MSKTATGISMRDAMAPDLRRMRTQMFIHQIMDALGDYIAPDDRRDVHDALYERIYSLGADVVTDQDREKAGLAPRGDLGWTADELRALELARLELMLRPIRVPFIGGDLGPLG